MLASLAIVTMLPLYDVLVAYPSFINALKEDAKDESVRIAKHLMSMLRLEKEELDGDSLAGVHDTIKGMRKDLGLQKIKAYSSAGKTIFTTDPEDIKSIAGKKEFHESISKGKVYVRLKEKGMKSLENHELKADVVETYVPLMDGARFLGAFEIYYDISGRKGRLNRLRVGSTALVSVSAFGLFLLVMITSFRARKNILERERIEEELRALSLTDDLTGLYNRRGFCALAGQQLKVANRQERGLLMLTADLDHLKEINDSFGHEEGDLSLVDTASVLKRSARESDIIARIGGDEFAIIAIETPDMNGETLTERIRNNMAAHNARANKPYELSLSIGVVDSKHEQTCSINSLLSAADKLMYDEKRDRQKRMQ